jgi:hypothetical protein
VRHRHSHEIWQDSQGAVYGEDLSYDAPRALWVTALWRLDPSGRLDEIQPPTAELPDGMGLWHDEARNSYAFAWPRGERKDYVLYRRSPDGTVTEIAGGFTGVNGKSWGPDGSLWVTDGAAVKRIAPGGAVETVGGDPLGGVSHGEHPRLLGLAALGGGGALVADYDHHAVREITPDGRVRERWFSGRFWSPAGVAVKGGAVYLLEARPESVSVFLESLGPAVRVRRIDPGGRITTLGTVRATAALPAGPLLLAVLAVSLLGAVLLLARRRRAWSPKRLKPVA